jgi:cytochrome c oxidase assembly protein subunit 15
MGWFMVMSGLADRPDVSHFRLAAHLILALVIFCWLLWLAFDFTPMKNDAGTFCQKRHGWLSFVLVAITITWGAFTAGLDGGLLYNTWPKMDAHWVPPEVTGLYSMLHDPGAVQFFHRWIAACAFVAILTFGWRMKNIPLMIAIFAQLGLGIATVHSQVAIPVAALHQAGAMVVLALMIRQLHTLHKGAV